MLKYLTYGQLSFKNYHFVLLIRQSLAMELFDLFLFLNFDVVRKSEDYQ